jgi:hypothetical protein
MSSRILFLAAFGLVAGAYSSACAAEDADAAARQEDERLLRESKVAPDAGGLVGFFRKRTLTEQDRRDVQQLVLQLGSRSFPQREKASRKLEEWGVPVLNYLTAARIHPDLEIARRAERCIEYVQRGPGPSLPCAAARALARLAPSEAVAILLEYLPFAEDEAIQDEILVSLTALGKDESRLGALPPALRDSSPIKRAAAGYVLGRSAGPQRVEVRKLLLDGDPQVRLRAAQGLLAGKDMMAVPALIALVACPVPEIAWQAEDMLLRVAGDQGAAPLGEGAKEGTRRDYRDRWAKWWSDSAAKVDLARIEHDPPQRGWTVVAQMSTSKVYEIDRQGKVRWSIDNLSGPIDAQALAGGRVLIAEHHGSKVTERNLQGAVLWEKRLEDRPVQAERLPGGNTFICTYSSVMEVKRDGTALYCHKPEGTSGQIYGGHKLRNGRIVCITLDGRIYEMDSTTGKVVKSLASGLNGCYSIQSLPRGHFLVSSYNEGKVHEVDGDGKVIWRHELASAYHAERLPNGNTLMSSHGGSRVVEIDRAGKVLNDYPTNANNVWRVHRR